jgi:hypothetical protein
MDSSLPLTLNPKHLVQSGGLIYFKTDTVMVSLQTPSEARKLLHLRFGRDGSIYAQFPYFERTHGVLKELIFPDGRAFPRDVDYGQEASVTSHLVKYAHHVDGEAHFSQDGKVVTKVRRRAFRLDGPIGHLFQMTAVDLNGFERLEPKDEKARRASISFHYDRLPSAVSIVADWKRRREFEAVVERSGGGPAGPVLRLVDKPDAEEGGIDHVLLSPPLHGRVSNHLLVLRCLPAGPVPGVHSPTIIFMGGWDHHEVKDRSQKVFHSGALFCMYPVDSEELIRSGLESVDFNR